MSAPVKHLLIAVCVILCAGVLAIQAVKGATVIGCFFPALGVVSGVFYLVTTRRGK